ncbi:hypothetical protein CCH79_00005167 [Gambusia affinis]|uniref:Chemokine interleukin-8-like domain-containing protein n=1 Tax=Gambusia affinis TaxID=33528 RepID=A0A315VSG6_GAMAF|nr:hypothetical protein CCH79_00005167 [Gambusia affinis]
MTSIPLISLVLVAVMVQTASAQGGISTCCQKFTGTKVPREILRSYYHEDKSSCRLQAVVFTTIRGKRICSSPFNLWTKTSMAFLDGKNFWQRQSDFNKQPNRKERGTSKCCQRNTRMKVHRTLLRSYYEQNDPTLCSVHSVIFITVKRKKLCAYPNTIWTKTSMAYLDGKNWQQRQTTFKKKLEN